MSDKTLRQLAKGYATGILSKEEYRKFRTKLIQGIVEGSIAVKAIDYAPPLDLQAEEEITERASRGNTETTQIKPEQQPTSNNAKPTTPAPAASDTQEKKSPVTFIAISAAIVTLLIIAVVLFYPKPPQNQTQNVTQSATSEDKSSQLGQTNENVASKAETLLADFLTENNWSEESLSNFEIAWSNLTNEERNAVSDTKRMQRMNDSIYRQFLEEKALASIDSKKAIMGQRKLINFASSIGITDSRLIVE